MLRLNVDDFIAGTLELSQADVGAYIRLLCYLCTHGSIPNETEKQQRLAGGPVSVDVLSKFKPKADAGVDANKQQIIFDTPTVHLPEVSAPLPAVAESKVDPQVESLYKTYPRKVGKVAAIKAIQRALKSHSYDFLIEATAAYAQAVAQWDETKLGYVPHPATWFNGQRFNDDRVEWTRNQKKLNLDPIALEKTLRGIEGQIETHKANPEFVGYRENPPRQLVEELNQLRKRLAEVRKLRNQSFSRLDHE